MTWQFTFIEYFYDSRETVIDEPVGYDALSMVLQRDPNWHGVSPQFSASNLQFAGIAYWVLKNEYERAGVDGNIGIRIEWKCDDCISYKLFFQGNIDFALYEEDCAEDCYIIAGIADNSALTQLKNRNDTDVDLTSSIAFDGVTTLPDYTGLNKVITIPSKALSLQAAANLDDTTFNDPYNLLMDADFPPALGLLSSSVDGFILPKLNNISLSEIETFSPGFTFDFLAYTGSLDSELDTFQIINVAPSTLGTTTNTYVVTWRLKGRFFIRYTSPFEVGEAPGLTSVSLNAQIGAKYKSTYTDAITPVTIVTYSDSSTSAVEKNATLEYDASGTFSVDMADSDNLWFYISMQMEVLSNSLTPPLFEFTIQGDKESFFNAKETSLAPPSPCNTFMLHEAASRVVESVTNNQLHFRSEYYGRTDSQPYSYDADGCGGLRTITNGLLVRRAVLTDGTAPKVFTNWQKMLDSLNALDLIGYGPEGNDIRVEPVKYFYKDAVVFVADGVNAYKKKVRNDRIWNQFNFGYDKYETESTNGLDALHTKRQFRIPITNSSTSLEKICNYILDGYAEEVTRRLFGSTSDWRYDQDIFMLCLKRLLGDVAVEQGNIDSPENMFDPPTVINYRLTPYRNFMRWFNWLVQGIRQIDPALTQLLFNSGDGNYVAKGKLQGTDCVEEAAAVAENDPLFENQYADIDNAKPFIVPEEVTFTFPLGLNEFLFLKQNMYGKIQYRRDEDDPWKFGWITKLEPHHEDGDAAFTLVTALNGTPVTELDGGYIITESGLVITTEDGSGFITEN